MGKKTVIVCDVCDAPIPSKVLGATMIEYKLLELVRKARETSDKTRINLDYEMLAIQRSIRANISGISDTSREHYPRFVMKTDEHSDEFIKLYKQQPHQEDDLVACFTYYGGSHPYVKADVYPAIPKIINGTPCHLSKALEVHQQVDLEDFYAKLAPLLAEWI